MGIYSLCFVTRDDDICSSSSGSEKCAEWPDCRVFYLTQVGALHSFLGANLVTLWWEVENVLLRAVSNTSCLSCWFSGPPANKKMACNYVPLMLLWSAVLSRFKYRRRRDVQGCQAFKAQEQLRCVCVCAHVAVMMKLTGPGNILAVEFVWQVVGNAETY